MKENIPKDYCPSDLKLMLSLSDAEERSLPGPESDGTRRIMEISSNTNKKVDDNSVTDPLPATAADDLNSENSNLPYELLPAKTRSRPKPFDVHGLLSGAMTARDTDPDFALALQKCREEKHSEYCIQCSQQKNRPCVVSESSEAHTCLRGCGFFFNAALLHHDSFADAASLCDTLCGHTEETLRLTLVLGLYLLEM